MPQYTSGQNKQHFKPHASFIDTTGLFSLLSRFTMSLSAAPFNFSFSEVCARVAADVTTTSDALFGQLCEDPEDEDELGS